MMRGDVRVVVVCRVSVAADRDGYVGFRICGQCVNQLIESDATDLRWAAEIRVVRDGIPDLRQREELFTSAVACGLLPSRAGNIAAEFEIGWRHSFPGEPSVQWLLRRCHRAGCLGVRMAQVQSSEKSRRNEHAQQDGPPPNFHGDMLAHALIFFTAICAVMQLANMSLNESKRDERKNDEA